MWYFYGGSLRFFTLTYLIYKNVSVKNHTLKGSSGYQGSQEHSALVLEGRCPTQCDGRGRVVMGWFESVGLSRAAGHGPPELKLNVSCLSSVLSQRTFKSF